MIFWSKTPDLKTKEGRRKKNRQDFERMIAHKEHMAASDAARDSKSSGSDMSGNTEGINEDLTAKAGQIAQDAKSISLERGKHIVQMRGRIRARRQKLRSKGKSAGF
ncbi:MAG TPA: hypothetical protein DIV86_06650 [Alphaproteobacteria bacterium]|nr:hypothetical protein [Alphaproteobacteria bacterium]